MVCGWPAITTWEQSGSRSTDANVLTLTGVRVLRLALSTRVDVLSSFPSRLSPLGADPPISTPKHWCRISQLPVADSAPLLRQVASVIQ